MEDLRAKVAALKVRKKGPRAAGTLPPGLQGRSLPPGLARLQSRNAGPFKAGGPFVGTPQSPGVQPVALPANANGAGAGVVSPPGLTSPALPTAAQERRKQMPPRAR